MFKLYIIIYFSFRDLFKKIKNYVYMCVSVDGYMDMSTELPLETRKGVVCPRARITDHCELSGMGAGNKTWVNG